MSASAEKIAAKEYSPKEMSVNYASLGQRLSAWFAQNERDLPWRAPGAHFRRDPYVVWLSEIMLQQTRVATVIDYFVRFKAQFPNVIALANATEDEILGLWSGLGYYSRGRNLHKAACQIRDDYGGVFPSTVDDLLCLAGVGSYTANAVASFAFDQPGVVVDGNVHRVLARLFNVDALVNTPPGHQLITEYMQRLVSASTSSAVVNEATMELGALVCTPKKPSCEACPFQQDCLALQEDTVATRPQKKKKAPRKKVHWVAVNIIFNDEKDNNLARVDDKLSKTMWLERNSEKRLFGGLYGPMAQELSDGEEPRAVALALLNKRKVYFDDEGDLKGPTLVGRVLTHRELYAQVFSLQSNLTPHMELGEKGCWYTSGDDAALGISAAAKAMLATAYEEEQLSLL
ncbi:MAG: A/G-specific adenine glycosylase [Deltaproteobacteria bacterium]|nr:A/G-specific adenine glycosylase [Deltaproteobacteria bacterium]